MLIVLIRAHLFLKGHLFSLKKYLPIQSMTSSCSENFWHPWRSHFNIKFFWKYNFSGKTAFLIVPHFSSQYQGNGLFRMKISVVQNQWISVNIMGHLCSICLELFLTRSSLFKLVMACYWLFHFLQKTKSQNVLPYKFTVNQLLQSSAVQVLL